MRRFGYLIASLSQAQQNAGGVNFFKYNNSTAQFIGEHIELKDSDESSINQEKQKQNDNVNRKMQLMKNMAQLRLEVNI